MSEEMNTVVKRGLFGRRKIFASVDVVTPDNVVEVVEKAYITHLLNRGEIEYLWRYYKGDQPSLYRVRELRDDLTVQLVENRASEIISFKVGFVVGKPITYVASAEGDDVSDSVARLNDAMRVIGKHTKDKSLIEWCMVGGLGYRYVTQNNNPIIRSPFNLYTLDPRSTFVIRRNDYTEEIIAAVNYVTDEQGNVTFTIFTPDRVYTLVKGSGQASSAVNAFGAIPIFEYQNNNARQGAFEIVLTLLDAINDFDCARNEAVQQFVQSLLVLYNCDVAEGTTADTIRQAGMILLKSMNGENADIKNLSEQLDQSQNQTLKDDMYNSVLQICGVPSQATGSTSDSSNNGAIVLKTGWQGAETRAEAFEAMFQEPEINMLRLVSVLCNGLSDFTFDSADLEVKFTRRSYADILSKSQTLVTMLGNDKIHPRCAYEASGLFVDTEEAYQMGLSWYEEHKSDRTLPLFNGQSSEEVTEEDDESP